MISPVWGGVFASGFFKVVQKSPKSETRVFPCGSRVWQFLNVFVLFWRDILEKMKLILTFCSISERENFLKTRFVRFSELGPSRVNFQLV